MLRTIVGGAWGAIKGVASTIQKWLDAVKNVAGKAFDWVARKLGFPSGTGEGGLLDWLKQKAVAIWEDLKKTLQPVIGPLKVVAGALLMFTGLPAIYAIVKYGPQIVDTVQWLWANRNNPDAVEQNPKLLGGSILPRILGAGQGFVGTVKKGASWLVEKISAFAGGALQLLGAITGIPVLGMARGFVQTLVDGVKGIQAWAVGAFTSAEGWLEGLFHKVADFIKPYAEVLCSVATAAVNPAGIPLILAGWAWRWLPDCIKPPLIDLLLDAVITVVEGLSRLPMLGPLWHLLKAGVVGFLRALRARDPQTKVKVSNKLAKIISGSSPAFLLGFVKGLLRGVWDGIKMPFEAIWMIAKGIGKAGDFFTALGNESDDKARQQPAAAQQPAATAQNGAPRPSRTAQALPGVPGEIHPDEAPAVVGRIAAQLNAQKPPRPTAQPGKPPGGAPPATPPASGTGKAMPANQYRALGQQARRMGSELAGPSKTVATSFGLAVHELFSSGKGTSIDDLMTKLHKVWEAAQAAVARQAAKIANMVCDFFLKDSAEEELGDTVGYMVGMIAFQALLDAFSAGAWSEVNVVLTTIARFLNWPMEFLGEAMAALKALGGFLLDGLKQLGKMAEEAGGGALREVTGALRDIAGKLREFADEILGKFGKDVGKPDGAAAHDGARAAEDDAAGAPKRDASAKDGERTEYQSAAEREAEKAEELVEALEVSRVIARAEDAGHVPGPAIATSLETLRSRYRWIKAFTAEPQGMGFEIFLIASKEPVYKSRQNGDATTAHVDGDPPLTPGARANGLPHRGRTLREAAQELGCSIIGCRRSRFDWRWARRSCAAGTPPVAGA